MKRFSPFFLILGILFLCQVQAIPAAHAQTLPNFTLSALDGKKYALSEYIGKKPLFLIFWTTWCPYCKTELPTLNKIYSEFSPKGLIMLSINTGINDTAQKAALYKQKHNLPYPVLYDKGQKVTGLLNIIGVPTIIIVDINGIIRYSGPGTPQDFGKHFNELLKKTKNTAAK